MQIAMSARKPRKSKVSAPAATAMTPQETVRMLNLKVTKVMVNAYSEEHARRLAAAVYGVDIGAVISVSPANAAKISAPKKCQTADFPQKGTRQWETEYQIWTYAQRVQVGLNKFEYIGLEFVKGGFKEKTPAVKAMRELALKHRLPMMVQIHKTLKTDSNVTAISEPDMAMQPYTVEFKS